MSEFLLAVIYTCVVLFFIGLIWLSARLIAYATIVGGGRFLGMKNWWIKQTYDKPKDQTYKQWERHLMLTHRVPAAAAGTLLFVLTTALAMVVLVP